MNGPLNQAICYDGKNNQDCNHTYEYDDALQIEKRDAYRLLLYSNPKVNCPIQTSISSIQRIAQHKSDGRRN